MPTRHFYVFQNECYFNPNRSLVRCNISSKILQKSSAVKKISVNLYKEYTSLKSRELEELPRFRVMSW